MSLNKIERVWLILSTKFWLTAWSPPCQKYSLRRSDRRIRPTWWRQLMTRSWRIVRLIPELVSRLWRPQRSLECLSSFLQGEALPGRLQTWWRSFSWRGSSPRCWAGTWTPARSCWAPGCRSRQTRRGRQTPCTPWLWRPCLWPALLLLYCRNLNRKN